MWYQTLGVARVRISRRNNYGRMMLWRYLIVTMINGLLLASLTMSCSKSPSASLTRARIGPEGGVVSAMDHGNVLASVAIPAGALEHSETIGINTNIIDGYVAFALSPEAMHFSREATLSLSYPDDDNDGLVDGTPFTATLLSVEVLDESTGHWNPIPSRIDTEKKVVVANISHFSLYRWWFGRYPTNSQIRYCIKSVPPPSYGWNKTDLIAGIGRAIRAWGEVTSASGIKFVENCSSFDIAFLAEKPYAEAALADTQHRRTVEYIRFRPSTTLAACSVTGPHGEGVCRSRDKDIETITLHELGHALGLSHPDPLGVDHCSVQAVMCADYQDVVGAGVSATLHSWDITAYDAIYDIRHANAPGSSPPTASANIGGFATPEEAVRQVVIQNLVGKSYAGSCGRLTSTSGGQICSAFERRLRASPPDLYSAYVLAPYASDSPYGMAVVRQDANSRWWPVAFDPALWLDGTLKVGTEGCVNGRAGPSLNGQVFGCIAKGKAVQVTDEAWYADGYIWVKVAPENLWVAARFLCATTGPVIC